MSFIVMLPNFLIVGAEKSGTTSLVSYLSHHEDIFIPLIKEIHFFNNTENYQKGIQWYEKCFSDWDGQKAVGECTPLYMYESQCAERIAVNFPKIKIIFILRNPADRAYSNYWHQVRGGRERLSFEESLINEDQRIAQGLEQYRKFSYAHKGYYYKQLKRFWDRFSTEQTLVLLLEELEQDPQSVIDKTCIFLNVAPLEQAGMLNIRKNVTRIPRNKTIQYVARVLFGNSLIFKIIRKINILIGPRNYPYIEEETKNRLLENFSEDIKKLKELTKLDFKQWYE